MASSAPSWPGVRPVKTCTECKQSKLRCDSKDRRLEAMSRELRELRDQRLAEARASSTTSPDPDTSRSQDSSINASQPSVTILLDDFDLMGLESFDLGGVVINNHTVIEAFKYLSMHLGLPPMINTPSDLAAIRSTLSENTLPREFAIQLRVLLTLAGFTNVLVHNSNDGVIDSSVIQLLDGELDTLKVTFPDGWTNMTDLSVLVVKMHVYTLVITRSRSGTGAKEILLKLGLAAALRIIHLANSRFHERLDKNQTLTAAQREKTLPKDYYRGLAFATIFLLRYFSLNNNANAEEQQLAVNHVIMAHTIFKTLATRQRDEYDRAASLFETLCKQAPASTDASRPSLSDRMGVSIVLDAIDTARELRGFPINPAVPEIAVTAESLPRENNVSHPDVFAGNTQVEEPWSSDLVFANMFWGDPSWDIFNVPTDTPQFHSGHGL
ncbi:hypothetical protein Daesc_001358 [Daldinia eschscholtzii]|uniref:Zn(2)-C6 fungal-type domain-containing protein n=1 Tax=Daldinia eschscholtzii TaxID=292717 RepID=A0AAX6MTW9_9PEZI